MGIDKPMELFVGAAVDKANLGCELKLTSIFRSQEAATAAARGLSRPEWLVASWRTDQSGGVTIVAFSGSRNSYAPPAAPEMSLLALQV